MRLLKGHRAGHAVYAVAFGPGGRLASCGRDRTVRLWDLRTGKDEILAAETGNTTHVSYSPNPETVAWGGNGAVHFWDVAGGERRSVAVQKFAVSDPSPRYSPDGHVLAVNKGFSFESWTLWDATTLQPLPAWREGLFARQSLAFSRDGKTLATTHYMPAPPPPIPSANEGTNCSIVLRDVATRQVRIGLGGRMAPAVSVAFSPDGSQLAAACGEFLRVWDTRTAETVYRHKIDRRHFQSVAFSPDGRLLAVARNDASVRLYDARAWRPLVAFDWKIGRVLDVAFAPDGMVMAASGSSGKIMLWDVDV